MSESTANEKMNRSSRACLSCRKNKMKCENSGTAPCKRCEATGKNCVFTLRANAAIGLDHAGWSEQVEMRLYDLEVEVRSWRRRRDTSANLGAQNPVDTLADEENGIQTDDADNARSAGRSQEGGSIGESSRVKRRRLTDATHTREVSSPSPDDDFMDIMHTYIPTSERARDSLWNAGGDGADAVSDAALAIQRCMQELAHSMVSGSGIHMEDDAWAIDRVEHMWTSFRKDILPHIHAGRLDAEPGQATPLFIASALYAVNRCSSAEDGSYAYQPYQRLFNLAFLQLATVHLDDASSRLTKDRRGYADALAILIFCHVELGRELQLSGYIAWAHQTIQDSVGLGDDVSDDEWRTLWDAFYDFDQQHTILHLRKSIFSLTPPHPRLQQRAAVLFPNAAEEMASINQIGLRHFAGRGFRSILDRLWRSGNDSSCEWGRADNVDATVLKEWLDQLRRCGQRHDVHDTVDHTLNRLAVEMIAGPARSGVPGVDVVSLARRALQYQTTRPLTSISAYHLVLLTSAALFVLEDSINGYKNVVDLQLVLQLMVYLKNMAVPLVQTLAQQLHSRLTSVLQVTNATGRTGKIASSTIPITLSYNPAAHGIGSATPHDPHLIPASGQTIHDWNVATDQSLSSQYPEQLLDDFDQIFAAPLIGPGIPESLPVPTGRSPGSSSHMNPNQQITNRQSTITSPVMPQLIPIDSRIAEKWPPTFLSWLNTSSGDASSTMDLYNRM